MQNALLMLNQFLDYLNSIGVKFAKGDDSVISFEKDGLVYMFICDEKDPYYFRLILPNIGDIKEDDPRVSNVVNQMNLQIKAAKAVVLDKKIWVSVEQFVYSADKINDLFKRSIQVLEVFVANFRNALKNEVD